MDQRRIFWYVVTRATSQGVLNRVESFGRATGTALGGGFFEEDPPLKRAIDEIWASIPESIGVQAACIFRTEVSVPVLIRAFGFTTFASPSTLWAHDTPHNLAVH